MKIIERKIENFKDFQDYFEKEVRPKIYDCEKNIEGPFTNLDIGIRRKEDDDYELFLNFKDTIYLLEQTNLICQKDELPQYLEFIHQDDVLNEGKLRILYLVHHVEDVLTESEFFILNSIPLERKKSCLLLENQIFLKEVKNS